MKTLSGKRKHGIRDNAFIRGNIYWYGKILNSKGPKKQSSRLKEIINKMKRKLLEWKKKKLNHTSDKGW